jgi:hypothetical protein
MEDGTLDPRHDRFEKATTSVNGMDRLLPPRG